MPACEWAAEVAVDEALVRGVLGSQFPGLALESVSLLGEGFDNTVWLVDERWVVRFPRREVAVAPCERQVVLLPRLAPLLPLPVPDPAFVGRPSDDYRWPFFGAPLLPGKEIAEVSLDDEGRARAARPLAAFLRALHAPGLLELPGVRSLPVDPVGRADMGFRARQARERLDELRELELWDAPAEAGEILRQARLLPPPQDRAVAHGDLHLRHLLVDPDGTPAAVIDWDDLCVADPAIDLILYWSMLPPAARPEFAAEYGPMPEERFLRGRVLSLFLSGSLAVYGHHEGASALLRESIAALERTLEG